MLSSKAPESSFPQSFDSSNVLLSYLLHEIALEDRQRCWFHFKISQSDKLSH